MTVRTRIAPSPTGDPHVGTAYVALFNLCFARQHGGQFILRIEDTDQARSTAESEQDILKALRWLGLNWDEGPDVGGPHGPYRQSERIERFDAALEALVANDAVYACTCSRAQVRAAQSAPHLHESGERPYPGTCRGAGETLAPTRGGYRLDVERSASDAVCTWHDQWLGAMQEDVRTTCGDFLLGRPGAPSYQLAVVVDDAAMGVTDVIRGRDLLGSTARQRLLHGQLNNAPPLFGHHPLLVDDQGHKLSKRDRGLTLSGLREGGARPEQVIAAVARAIGLTTDASLSAVDFMNLLNESPPWRDGPWEDLR